MPVLTRVACAVCFASLLVGTTAVADIVHLTDGGRLEGTVTEAGDRVRVETRLGVAEVERERVVRIERTEVSSSADVDRRGDPPSLFELRRTGAVTRGRGEDVGGSAGSIAAGAPTANVNPEVEARRLYRRYSTASEEGRAAARAALGELPKEALREPSRDVLAWSDPRARTLAAETLGRAGTPDDMDLLARVALEDEDLPARRAAVDSLRAVSGSESAPQFIQIIQEEKSPSLRECNAIYGLGQVASAGDYNAIEVVITEYLLSMGGTKRAHFLVVDQRAYVRDFEVAIAPFAAYYDPVVGYVQSGVVLDVKVRFIEKYWTEIKRRYLVGALQRLSGQAFGDTPREWEIWWKDNRDKLR